MAKEKNSKGGTGLAVGLGVAAVAAAAAGAYFFYGPSGAKNRKNLKSWAVKAKAEVMENVEKMKDVSEVAYDKTVSQVLSKYKKLKSIAPAELAEVQKELMGSWKSVKAEIDRYTKKSGGNGGAKKTAKKK